MSNNNWIKGNMEILKKDYNYWIQKQDYACNNYSNHSKII